jgi:hypothetical protein
MTNAVYTHILDSTFFPTLQQQMDYLSSVVQGRTFQLPIVVNPTVHEMHLSSSNEERK